jgi:ATP-dependent protease HslVU (ClpYQ) peptidase subunit
MTLIVGVITKDGHAIGGDSGAFEDGGDVYSITRNTKVWAKGDVLFGGAGSFRSIEVAKSYNETEPNQIMAHMLKAELQDDWSLLVVTRKAIYEISPHGAIELSDPYGAIGGASSIGLGALAAISKFPLTARDMVARALDAGWSHSMKCAKPFKIINRVNE